MKKLTKDYGDYEQHIRSAAACNFFTTFMVFAGFVIIFILALLELTRYSEETFNSVVTAVVNIVLSTLIILLIAIILMCLLCYCGDKDDNNDDSCNKTCQTFKCLDYFITVMNFTFLGYFFPYMVISFIQDPLHSCFIFMIILSSIMLISIVQICFLVLMIFEDCKKAIAMFFTVFLGIFAVPYLLVVISLVFSLGSFEDFKDLENFIIPLLTTGVTSLIGFVFYCNKKNHRLIPTQVQYMHID